MGDRTPEETAVQKQQDGNLFRSYNYVGTKETVAYLFNDWSNSFNINGYKNRFIWDVVRIDFGVSAIVGLFTGAWDVNQGAGSLIDFFIFVGERFKR
ncbi:MAG: hypothetical protein IJK02_07240 [Clostridia bacterium]|nr:hypothetical protein [Clostridia bacterium]